MTPLSTLLHQLGWNDTTASAWLRARGVGAPTFPTRQLVGYWRAGRHSNGAASEPPEWVLRYLAEAVRALDAVGQRRG